jgi:hypothetical protein
MTWSRNRQSCLTPVCKKKSWSYGLHHAVMYEYSPEDGGSKVLRNVGNLPWHNPENHDLNLLRHENLKCHNGKPNSMEENPSWEANSYSPNLTFMEPCLQEPAATFLFLSLFPLQVFSSHLFIRFDAQECRKERNGARKLRKSYTVLTMKVVSLCVEET